MKVTMICFSAACREHTGRYIQRMLQSETLHLISNLVLQCGHFSVHQSGFFRKKTGHEREPSLFYLTIKSMKHRIRSHSTDDTCRQPSTHTSDHAISHKHYKVHLSKWTVPLHCTSRQTGLEIIHETKSVETNRENRLSPNPTHHLHQYCRTLIPHRHHHAAVLVLPFTNKQSIKV